MQSTRKDYYVAIDHIRAIAAFIVVTWHFMHGNDGHPIAFNYTPSVFPFAILDEGHTGVALFMTLSGYIFAKLTHNQSIDFKWFLWNRILRLLPLLTIVILIAGAATAVTGGSISQYAQSISQGWFAPTLPNGGWSITVEFHFYLLLPFLLWLARKSNWALFSLIPSAVILRTLAHQWHDEVQTLAYWTLVGRIDQFVLGILAYRLGHIIAKRHFLAVAGILLFMGFYWYFDHIGGFFQLPTYPSPSALWIILPTLEGMAYALTIAWYDNSFSNQSSKISIFIGEIGKYSYSIYLLHFFFAFKAAVFINEYIMDITHFHTALFWSMLFFVLMLIPAKISHQWIETPFLKWRKDYIKPLPGKGQNISAGVPHFPIKTSHEM